jgi:hypothetical protein
MNPRVQEFVCKVAGAYVSYHLEDIQSLWSGYGIIMRYGLKGADHKTVIVKHVQLMNKAFHPRGWDTDLSHQRKIKSYHVETAWYRDWASLCDESCRVPKCFGLEESDDEFLIVLEDLDASGFPRRIDEVVVEEHVFACLKWLANFHATFMGKKPEGLWEVGTYWHLDTRPDELEALEDKDMKAAAPLIDQHLSSARYQTFVHGDAKLANFCFSEDGQQVAAVDFQYVGGGCGMKDVAYFIGSCLHEEECERYEAELLRCYFSELRKALTAHGSDIDQDDLEREWRGLYHFACVDFHRFLKGWNPDHWKIHEYSERVARQVLDKLVSTPE